MAVPVEKTIIHVSRREEVDASVACGIIRIPSLKRLVGKFGALLGQEAMYFEVGESLVEFIPPLVEENPADD